MMVTRLKNNQLVFWTLIANAVYWLVGLATPIPYVSSAASLVLLVTSAGMFLRYAPSAFDVVVNGRRDAGEGGQGSHLALYGATLIAAGSCYVGLFGFLWILADQPDSWLGTAQSGYGRAVMSAGFALMALSPDNSPSGIKLPNLFLIILLIVAVAIGSFFAGRKTVPQEQAVFWRGDGALVPPPMPLAFIRSFDSSVSNVPAEGKLKAVAGVRHTFNTDHPPVFLLWCAVGVPSEFFQSRAISDRDEFALGPDVAFTFEDCQRVSNAWTSDGEHHGDVFVRDDYLAAEAVVAHKQPAGQTPVDLVKRVRLRRVGDLGSQVV
jgi:hypothetical protein